MSFDVNGHLTRLKGKDYLEVKWRLVWFRDDHPDWSIETEPLILEDKKAVFRAYVKDSQGRVLAMGTKSETPAGFADFIEKAETGSVGRALAHLGYGTQFAPELEEGERIVDSPVERPRAVPPVTIETLYAEAAKAGIDQKTLTDSLMASDKLKIKSVSDLKSGQIQVLLDALQRDPAKFKASLLKEKVS